MISPGLFDEMAARSVAGAEERFVGRVLEHLATSLVQGGELTAKDYRDIEVLAQANHEALQSLLIRHKGEISAEAERVARETLAASSANDLALLKAAYPSVAAIGATRLFQAVSAQTVQAVQSIIARQNVALVGAAERLWYEVAGDAVTAWQHRLATMDEIVSEAVRRLSAGGLSVIDYRSGQHTSVDAAIRRHMVSQLGQASGRITMGYMDAYGHELVMTSAHFGSRPDHEPWQGKAFCTSGRKLVDGVLYADFHKATGYGTIAGLLGVNCRHSFGPYYPGISELPEVEAERNGMTSSEYYDATQRQRGMERRIRDKKREIALGQKAGLPMAQERLELGRMQGRLKGYVDSKGLVRQPAREKAYGIGAQPRALRGGAAFSDAKSGGSRPGTPKASSRSGTGAGSLAKALNEAEKSVEGLDFEVSHTFTPTGRLLERMEGKEHKVTPTASLKGNILTHNHPGGGNFSITDIRSFASSELRELRATTPQGTYYSLRAEGNADYQGLKSALSGDQGMTNRGLMLAADRRCIDKFGRGGYTNGDVYASMSEIVDEWLDKTAIKHGFIYTKGKV